MAFQAIKNNRLITPTELSKMINRSRVTIWRWVNNDTLPSPVRINGSVLGWQPDAIAQWLDKNTH